MNDAIDQFKEAASEDWTDEQVPLDSYPPGDPKLQEWIDKVLDKFSPTKGAAELPGFLAKLPPIEYDHLRKPLAKKIGVRPSTLDETRNQERRRGGNGGDWWRPGHRCNVWTPLKSSIKRYY